MKITQILAVLLGLLAIFLFVRLWTGTGSLPEIWELEAQIERQRTLNEQQTQRNEQLQADVTELSKNDTTIEDHARSELGMIKKNETFYQVILREDEQKQPLMVLPKQTDDSDAE